MLTSGMKNMTYLKSYAQFLGFCYIAYGMLDNTIY
jgi:hypothetical protein